MPSPLRCSGKRRSVRGAALLGILLCLPAAFTLAAAASDAPGSEPDAGESHREHQALRELDRFLDHHPLLEDDLRLSPELATDSAYLHANPELGDFLTANTGVVAALASEPRHLLRRALMIQASAPIRWIDIAQLDALFDRQPALERELTRHPELIHDEKFLRSHALLRDFLANHAPLGRVFMAAKN